MKEFDLVELKSSRQDAYITRLLFLFYQTSRFKELQVEQQADLSFASS